MEVYIVNCLKEWGIFSIIQVFNLDKISELDIFVIWLLGTIIVYFALHNIHSLYLIQNSLELYLFISFCVWSDF